MEEELKRMTTAMEKLGLENWDVEMKELKERFDGLLDMTGDEEDMEYDTDLYPIKQIPAEP